MAIVDFAPSSNRYRKKPISKKRLKQIMASYAKVPAIQKALKKQIKADEEAAEHMLNINLS